VKARLPQFLLRVPPENRHDRFMSFLVRRRQRESIRAHATVSTQAIALVLETVDSSSFERVAPSAIEARVRDSELYVRAQARASTERLSERPPLLVETTTSADDETAPPVSESWRVRAASKAYEAIAPERPASVTPLCSRRC
jgi:hypothetical protein